MATEMGEQRRARRAWWTWGRRQEAPRRPTRAVQACADKAIKNHYKDASLLKYFITDRGKLVPRRLTGNCAKHQRAIAVSVNRARMIALMPFGHGSVRPCKSS